MGIRNSATQKSFHNRLGDNFYRKICCGFYGVSYRRDYTFAPEALHAIDYHIEGKYGTPIPIELFDEYQQVDRGHTVVYFVKKAPIKGWKKDENKQFFYLRA